MSDNWMPVNTKDATSASSTDYVNYMDIKLEGVHQLPADWISAGFPAVSPGAAGGASAGGSSHAHTHGKEGHPDETEIAFAFHPFRYEVTLSLPCVPTKQGTGSDAAADGATPEGLSEEAALPTCDGALSEMSIVASFKRGRLLAPLSQYTSYITAAEPPPAPGVDDVSPLRDVPIPINAEDTVDHISAGVNENEVLEEENAASTATVATPVGAPAILWVVTDRTDASSVSTSTSNTDTVGAAAPKRRGKASAALGASSSTSIAAAANNAAAAGAPGAPAPPLPESGDPAPCVIRVPLTAAQEAYLDSLLESGTPLRMHFRRVLRPGCPSEWVDYNAGYFEADIPVSLHALTEPGSTHLTADVGLQPISACDRSASGGYAQSDNGENADRGKKRAVTRKQRQLVPSILIDGPDRDAPHPYVMAGTMATVSLTLQRTLTRLVSDRVRPAVTPAQLIPPRPPPTVSAAAADDVQTCLQKTLRGIVQKLVRDIRGAAKSESSGPFGPESGTWRDDLVLALEGSGELAAFKSKLTPLVTGLVQERLRRDPPTGGSPQEVARASSELYVQLMDMLHNALHESSGEDDAGSSVSQLLTTSSGGMQKESEEREVRWRAIESEVTGDVEVAAHLYLSRLSTHVTGDNWAALWVDCALFYQRTEELAKAEQCYREAIACNPASTPALLDYGAWLLAHDRLDEAAVFLHGLVDYAPQHKLGWGCIALLADLHELAIRVGSPDAVAEQKKWRREQRLALRKAVECGSVIPKSTTGDTGSGALPENADPASAPSPISTPAPPQQDIEEENMYFEVATYLVNLHHRDLANVCLARCRPGEPRVELLYASLFTQGGQYEEALATLEAIQAPSVAYASAPDEVQRLVDRCALLRAECAAALGRPSDAVKLYKQALCHGERGATAPPYLATLAADWQAQSLEGRSGGMTDAPNLAKTLLDYRITETDGTYYLSAYLRLCNLLLAEGRYRDTLGVVTLALQVWPSSSVLWLGAGIAYYRAGDLIQAEECLQESNTLNPSNPRTWAYLALLAARLQEVGVEELVQHLLTLSLEDVALWAELGRTLLGTAEYPSLSALCLRRAVTLADSKADSAQDIKLSTQYHLAHALMDLQQWKEAERLLSNIASHSDSNEVLRGKAEEELAMLRVSQ